MMAKRNWKNIRAQHGAALVIGLILLLVLTVMGVSGLGTAAVEVRIADNNKQKEYAFQSGESAISQELVNGAPITLDGTEVEGDSKREAEYPYSMDTGGSATADVQVDVDTFYRSRNPAPGFEIGTVDAIHFELDAVATAGRGASSRQRQGFYIPAPSP